MTAVQGLFALAMLSLMLGSSTANELDFRNYTDSGPSSWLPDSCVSDITDAEAYKTEHPICARLAAGNQDNIPRPRCVEVQERPVNITFHWDKDPTRAASALLAAVLHHVLGFQRVHVPPQKKHWTEFSRPEELLIGLAEELWYSFELVELEVRDPFVEYGFSRFPTGRRVHAWLTPAARANSACRADDWAFYSNLTALSLCGFIDPLPDSYDVFMEAVEVLGVGDDCKPTMQKLLQRAKAVGYPARAMYVSRADLLRELKTSKYSFLFLDFDIWAGEPSVHVVQPPRCVTDSDDCQSELESSHGMYIADIALDFTLHSLLPNFRPTPQSLRKILELEANGVNLEEAACELAQNYTTYISEEVFQNFVNLSLMKPDTLAVIYLCYGDPDNDFYDRIIRNVTKQIFKKYSRYFVRYYVSCFNSDDMRIRLDDLMHEPRELNVLGVVSLTVEGAAAASAAADAHRVPLLLPRAVPDAAARGGSTWRTAGRLRHVALALHHFVAESGSTRLAVLSQPSNLAHQYFAALQDKAPFFLRNFEIPFNLTEQLAKKALQDLQATKTRMVLVNTDSQAAALILDTATKLNMSYSDGFIWVVREPQIRSEYGTKSDNNTMYFTVSLSNQVKEGMSRKQLDLLDVDRDRRFLPPHSVALADALMTLETGFNNIFVQNPYLQSDLRSNKLIRAFGASLEAKPVAGLDGVERHYKDGAVEEANVYVDKWPLQCGPFCKPQRLATWRVNVTSGSVRNKNGSQPTLNFDFRPTRVSDCSDYGKRFNTFGDSGDDDISKQHINPTDKRVDTSNLPIIVHQWIESITKIETTKSNLSVSDKLNFPKFNQLNSLNTFN